MISALLMTVSEINEFSSVNPDYLSLAKALCPLYVVTNVSHSAVCVCGVCVFALTSLT